MKVLVTGGAGFIGSNLTERLLSLGHVVTVFDNLSRTGTKHNLDWISNHSDLSVIIGDVRDQDAISKAVNDQDVVFHLAAQVAVTTSVTNPRADFETNLLGTFNVLEAVRKLPVRARPTVILTSTNKVYGRMAEVGIIEGETRYAYSGLDNGVPEGQGLDFHSPYGCSKGGADQYVRDYARVYGLRTIVFRMSCIYGPRQFGNEDQGWVAHFLISRLLNKPATVYGNGKQVRDILFISDLVDAFLNAADRSSEIAGEVFNIGGGPKNTLSILELLEWINKKDNAMDVSFAEWRPGDQPVYISDINAAFTRLGWYPRIDITQGLERLWQWISANKGLMYATFPSSAPGGESVPHGITV